MSYQKNTWVDHIVDPGTGEIVQQGTKFTATRANNIETGIEKAHQLVEGLAQNILGSSVISGLAFTANGLTANYSAGSAYVNGVKFDVAAGSIQLNATQGQFIYLDSDGMVKNTTAQATADAKCKLWYFATDATSVITSTDNRNIVSKDTFVKQTDVATSGVNKIPRLDAQGKGAFSITGDAATVGGKSLSANSTADTVALRDASGDLSARQLKSSVATGTAPLSVSSTTTVTNLSADMVDGYHVGTAANNIPKRDAVGRLIADQLTNYKKTKSGKDANGIFTVVEYRRIADNTLYMKSTFSNPDAKGNYQTDTRVYYKTDGVTVDYTVTVTITYDADGDVISEVPSA
ncbi:hypothetical protein [Brevibacillus fulvus]|uniref:Uncharacterized protein n=1 Tax=Brevibacillus fulvus TaxID=1125967 RepID=A0A939BUX0_9BACL|nr:hypothetical protein [Brevibacillus fulvus]MBM7590869.1 hypothetical protein [Brevibacillus fulvus]